MPGNRIQLNGFGRLGRIQEQVLAAGVGSLNAALPMAAQPGETVYVLPNYHMPETTRAVRQQKFCGPSCARCHHRFGTTSNAAWCKTHWQQSRCYRFKLEKQ